MADVKISALGAIASVAGEDLVAIVDDPSGTPASRKATIDQIKTYIDALTASSTATFTNKTFDANATGNSLSNVDLADLSATGTKDATTFLRGDNTWAVVDSSPLTTKGDLYTYDTGNARLPVGTDGYYLKADSSTSTGLAWAEVTAGGAHTTQDWTVQSSAPSDPSAGTGVMYVKTIDSNNEGLFIKMKKNGSIVEVQVG